MAPSYSMHKPFVADNPDLPCDTALQQPVYHCTTGGSTVLNSYYPEPLRNLLASECLHNQFPLHVAAEPVHLEQFTVVEGRKVVDVDLASLGGGWGAERGE